MSVPVKSAQPRIKCWERGSTIEHQSGKKLASLLRFAREAAKEEMRWILCKLFHSQTFHDAQQADAMRTFKADPYQSAA